MKPSNEEITKEKIIEMATTWANYRGWTAETCGMCRREVNVLDGGAGWFCDCEHFNIQSFFGSTIPHSKPDMGPSQDLILQAHQEAKEIKSAA